jgi:hypothetical protein
MNDHEIFLLADECDQSFQKALAAALPNRPVYRSLLACHQRFELWAGFVGAFADEQASLDRRLKFSPDLQRAVVQLLLLVRKSLQRGKTWSRPWSDETDSYRFGLRSTNLRAFKTAIAEKNSRCE